MSKAYDVGKGLIAFHCPGCRCGHMVAVSGSRMENGAGWQWNGSYDAPTFSPSILIHSHEQYELPPTPRCHSFVTDGMIQFLPDCTHDLAGKTVPIPDWG